MKSKSNVKSQRSNPKPKSKSKPRKPKSMSPGYNMGTLASNFACALRDPFSPDSYGVRVPDPFSFPTATHHLHGEIILGNGVGSGSVLFYPNPILSLADLSNCVENSTSSMANFTKNSYIKGATQPGILGAIYGEYRVASWGIKISNLMPELSATGRIVIAPFVLGDTVPSFGIADNVALDVNTTTLNTTGYTLTSITSSAVLNMPDAIELAVQDLLHGSVELGCSAVNPVFFSFKTCQPTTGFSSNGALGVNQVRGGDEVATNFVVATGLPVANNNQHYQGFKDPTRCNGGVGWLVYYEGCPTTTTSNILVEYIYHLEGTANLANATAKLGPVSSVPPLPYVGSTGIVEEAMSVNSPTSVITWITKGAQFLNKASKDATGKGILSHAKTLAGLHPIGNKIMRMFG